MTHPATKHDRRPQGRVARALGRWQRLPLYGRIAIGGAVGIVIGLLLPPLAAVIEHIVSGWRDPAQDVARELSVLEGLIASVELPGKLVLRVLGALAPALVLVAVVRALMHAELGGRSGRRLVKLLLLNTVVAISIGLVVANVVRPGAWNPIGKPQEVTKAAAASNPLTQFLDNIPKSLFGPLGDDGRVLSVIFLALAFGVALRRLRYQPIANVDQLTRIAFEALVIVLHWVLELIPLAVFGIVAALIGRGEYRNFVGLGAFVVAVVLALSIQAVYYLVRVRLGSWVRPWNLIVGMRDALVMAFSTGSSTA
ncbi:MAG TPA: cation:dicarboxylase symporter family transporter, partial [Pirellulales bacterium]|nr:cation:dicarboxylase symporter family transporter [Pirellulales bacterium]